MKTKLKRTVSGAAVTVYAIFIMLILSLVITVMTRKVSVSAATRADTYLERQAYWNAHAGRSLALRLNIEDRIELGSNEGWDIGQIVIPASGEEAIGQTGRGNQLDIAKTVLLSQ